MQLFKFAAKKWHDAFFDSGSLRIGTLHEFHDTVTFTASQGDEFEGRAIHRRDVESLELLPGRREPIIEEFFGVQAAGVVLQDVAFQVERRSANAYIFCTSYLFSEDMFRRYRDEWGANACYAIEQPDPFFAAVSKVVRDWANWAGVRAATYAPDAIDYQSNLANVAPALIKRESLYAWQREIRGFWAPKGPCLPLEARFPLVPAARAYARPFAVLEGDTVRYL